MFLFMMTSYQLTYWMSLVATDSSRLKQRRSSASLFSQPERMCRGVFQLFRGLLVSNIITSCCWRVRIEAAESSAWPPPKIGTSEMALEILACGSDLRNHQQAVQRQEYRTDMLTYKGNSCLYCVHANSANRGRPIQYILSVLGDLCRQSYFSIAS